MENPRSSVWLKAQLSAGKIPLNVAKDGEPARHIALLSLTELSVWMLFVFFISLELIGGVATILLVPLAS